MDADNDFFFVEGVFVLVYLRRHLMCHPSVPLDTYLLST